MKTEFTDDQLVARVQKGDEEAMSALYRRHRPAIYRYALSRVADPHQAQDVTGEIFLRMIAHLPRYETTGAPFTAWLFRIAHNFIISHLQKENAFVLVPVDYANSNGRTEEDPAKLVEHKSDTEWIRRGLQLLEESQRDVIVMRFLVGLSLKETALAMDKSVGAIKTLQRRGILSLRAVMHIA